ncbi:peptidoglycan DD-metalloendopeptidase family protein [Streptomyces sp. NPDC008150]|uniref:M23 family metallopeptidase n=1 Tax=Streptomyces sp. NPDC008150 TaxID=3364816 RepID=UPI0036E8EEBF
MRSRRRHPLLVPVLLIGLAVFVARPGGGPVDGGLADGVADAQVVRLDREAAVAARQYEEGRRQAREQRARARRLEERLGRERRRAAVLHTELVRSARTRDSGAADATPAAATLLAGGPEGLTRGRHLSPQAVLAVRNAIDRSRRSEARLSADQARATSAWRSLERRNTQLAALKRDIGQRLDEARQRLVARETGPAVAGPCGGAARPEPREPSGRAAAEGRWVAPVRSYELTAGFGSGGARWANRHTGQDFAVPLGTPVRAVGAGRVVRVLCGGAFGVQLVLRHPDGYCTQYAHLSAVAVRRGETVSAGQVIARSGSTGNSTGPHLHFEVRRTPGTGSSVDPLPWLEERGVRIG